MKRSLLLCVSLFGVMCFGVSASATECASGVDALSRHDYAGALRAYDLVPAKGSVTWYNMGICYYMLERYPEALVCWKRAQRGASRQLFLDADYNCQQTQAVLGVAQEPTYKDHMMIQVRSLISPQTPFSLQLCSLCVLLVLFGTIRFRRRIRRRRGWLIGFVGGVCVMFLSASFVAWYDQRAAHAVVLHDSITIHAGPNNSYHALGRCKGGAIVALEGETNGWCRIRDGTRRGWVAFEQLGMIDRCDD